MSRTIPAAIVSALALPEVSPFYAVEMNFDGGSVRLWTGYGDRTIDGETYLGTGNLLDISGIEEIGDLGAKGASISLSGIDASIISLALSEPYQGRTARVLFGVVDVDDFVEVFAGLMDVMTIQHSGASVTVQLTIESKLVRLQSANIRRYTQANHTLRHPNDDFFSNVTDIADKELLWGRNA